MQSVTSNAVAQKITTEINEIKATFNYTRSYVTPTNKKLVFVIPRNDVYYLGYTFLLCTTYSNSGSAGMFYSLVKVIYNGGGNYNCGLSNIVSANNYGRPSSVSCTVQDTTVTVTVSYDSLQSGTSTLVGIQSLNNIPIISVSVTA